MHCCVMKKERLAGCFHGSARLWSVHTSVLFVIFVISGIQRGPWIAEELQGSVHRHPDRQEQFFPQCFKEFLQYLKCEMQHLHNLHQRQRWEQEDCIASPANNSFVNILKYINKWFQWQLFYTGVYCFVLFYLISPLKGSHKCDRLFSYQQKRRVSEKPVKTVMGQSSLFNLC